MRISVVIYLLTPFYVSAFILLITITYIKKLIPLILKGRQESQQVLLSLLSQL